MTTFAFTNFKSAESIKVVEDGQVATTSGFYHRSGAKNSVLRGERHGRNVRRVSSEAADEAYSRNEVALEKTVDSGTKQRYRDRQRNRPPQQRLEPLTKARFRLRHRLKKQLKKTLPRVIHKLRQELSEWRKLAPRTNSQQDNVELCSMTKRVVQFDTPEYNYYPDYYEEVRCDYPAQRLPENSEDVIQTCFDGVFRCVQIYKDLYFTKVRKGERLGEVHNETQVPVDCRCMWPKDAYAHLEL